MKGVKSRYRMRWLFELAAFLLLILLINSWQSRDAPTGTAPDFTGTLLDGSRAALSHFRGRPVLLHFWATWCPVCAMEQGTIDALAEEYQVVTVAIDDDSAAVQDYLRTRGFDYPVIHDPDGAIARTYAIRGIPASFVLDAEGRIRFVEMGYTTGLGLRLRLWWAGRNRHTMAASGT